MDDEQLERRCQAVLDAPPIIDDGAFPHEHFADARERVGLPRFYDGLDAFEDYAGPSGPVSFTLADGTTHTPSDDPTIRGRK